MRFPSLISSLSIIGALTRTASGLSFFPSSRPFTLLTLSMSTNRGFLPLNGGGKLSEEQQLRAQRCLEFLDSSVEPFHVVQTVTRKLHDAGFTSLDSSYSTNAAKLVKGGKYYFTRNGSSIVAFTIGRSFDISKPTAIKVLGAHTDSPGLKLKPKSKRSIGSGMVQLNVECYGGGLWHTWFDRDLSIAGRVILRTKDGFVSRLVKVESPVLRIPNLCIHLRTQEERDAFKVNKEDHLQPILCGEVSRALLSANSSIENSSLSWKEGQEPLLLTLLAQQLQCEESDIEDFELSVFDTQRASLTGLQGDYLTSGRIDNLASCFSIVEALTDHSRTGLDSDGDISVMALFDHEEVGSESSVGAGSTLISDAIDHVRESLIESSSDVSRADKSAVFKSILNRSFIMSVDMAHAVHPNYASKHEKTHSPAMNQGMVIKSNVNQRYATNGVSAFLTRQIAQRAGLPIQEFAVRNDCPCGSTIGPVLSTNTGIRAVDIGMPQLSMHSIREMMGAADLTHSYKLFRAFLSEFSQIDQSLKL